MAIASYRSMVWSDSGLQESDQAAAPLADGWARVRVDACGVCGSDLYAWREASRRRIGTTPGHEIAGTVAEGPPDLVGRLCAVSPNVTCGRCEFCLAGRSNLCRRGGYGIGLGRNGGFAQYVECPAENLYPVAETVPAVVASLTEPLAVCYHAIRLAHVEPASRAMIIGAGTLGLLSLVLLSPMIQTVGVVARHPHQRAAVEELGGTVLSEDDRQEWARRARPDVVIETAGGDGQALGVGVQAVRRGGTIAVLGSMGQVMVDMGSLMFKEASIIGSFCYGWGSRAAEFGEAADLLPVHQDRLSVLLRHQYSLSEAEDAFRCAADKSSGALKVTLTP